MLKNLFRKQYAVLKKGSSKEKDTVNHMSDGSSQAKKMKNHDK